MIKKSAIFLLLFLFGLRVVPALANDHETTAINEALQSILSQSSYVVDGAMIDLAELKPLYLKRNYKPIWETDPQGDRASLKNFLSTVTAFTDYHGLAKSHYPVEQLNKLIASTNEDDSPKIELLVTSWLFKLAHELHGDTIKLANLYPGWNFKRQPLDILSGFEKAIGENRIYEFIADLAPTNSAYLRLARDLKAYRAMEAVGPWPSIPSGPTIRAGDHDQRLIKIRARLVAENYLQPTASTDQNTAVYDKELQQAIENYQARNGLKPDGALGAKTIATMNVPLDARIGQIIANMERWRHMPESLPPRYAMVNIAAATVEVREDGKSIYFGPVIVGRPDRKTPFIQSAIRSVIFNPSWHVPAKIARKDILPKLRKDPYYLEKMGFVINGSADDPHGAYIDWNEIRESDFNFRLRQSPGDINSLGRLKFDFDNNFAVYMHGTPHPELFEKAERNQSSGCVRLRDPDQFATVVLARNENNWDLERVQAEVDKRKTHWLKVAEPLPVYFVYWSVFPGDDEGPLNFRHDVYNYDRFLLDVMREKDIKESPFAAEEAANPLI